MLSLPAFVFIALIPPAPIPRNGSPPGCSTLITRAPRSARCAEASGPAMIVAKSSTSVPSSAGAPEVSPPVNAFQVERGESVSESNTSNVCCPERGTAPLISAGLFVN